MPKIDLCANVYIRLPIAVLAVLMGLCYGQESEPQQKPLSVCEVLERRAELMGRYETLEGKYKTAPGLASSRSRCLQTINQFITHFRKLPKAVDLEVLFKDGVRILISNYKAS